MTADKQIIKIINKAKDGITLKVPGGSLQKMTWTEFNQNFVMTEDKKHCHCTEAFAKKMDEIDVVTSDIIVNMVLANGTKNHETSLARLAIIGENVQKLQQILGCSHEEAVQFVQNRMNTSAFDTHKRHKETPAEYRERKQKEAAERKRQEEYRDPHHTYKPTATNTMADIPGMDKLKDMFTGKN